jgi:hypothetical protein
VLKYPYCGSLIRVRDLRCGDEMHESGMLRTRVRRNGFTVMEVDVNVRSSTIWLISHVMAPHEVRGGQEQSRSTCLAFSGSFRCAPQLDLCRIHVFGVNNHSGGVNKHATG